MKFDLITDQSTGKKQINLDLSDRQTRRLITQSIKEMATNNDIVRILIEKNPKAKSLLLSDDADQDDIENLIMSLDLTLDKIRKHGWDEKKWDGIKKTFHPKIISPNGIIKP